MAEAVRLAKRVAAMVPCSRREAELYIEGGWVRVDGQVVEAPQARVADTQHVDIDPGASPAALEPVTLLLHKPAGVPYADAQRLLAPASRAPDDASGIRSVRKHFGQLAPLMPMLPEASGLAVFSQDFRVVRKLTEDERFIEQELVVQVSGKIADGGLERLCHGLTFNGKPLPPARASWQSETRLRFAVKGITPGQAAWMCEQVGLKVEALKRIRIGRVPMAGLAPGQWRYLPAGERF
jgi:23S rRNA pseudouridine2604 synthase